MIMFYTSKIISRMQFLTLEVATQKAETRISCNTIATLSSYLERGNCHSWKDKNRDVSYQTNDKDQQ